MPGQYPDTCRLLDDEHLTAKKAEFVVARRRPPTRLKSQVSEGVATDELHGETTVPIDDSVLRRADGMWAYNPTVTVNDAKQDVTEVVRDGDLMSSAPRQAYLAGLLGNMTSLFVYVPLVVNSGGRRLSRHDDDVTLGEVSVDAAQRWVLDSLGGGNGSGGGRSAEFDSIADFPEALCMGLKIPREQVIFQGPFRYPRDMPIPLIIHHSPTPLLQEVLNHAPEGTNDPMLEDIDVRVVETFDATIDDLTSVDIILPDTLANFGYVSGAPRHFFDTTFREIQEVTKGLPFSYWIRGDFDTISTEDTMKTTAAGYKWELAAGLVVFVGSLDDNIPDRLVNFGGTTAVQILG